MKFCFFRAFSNRSSYQEKFKTVSGKDKTYSSVYLDNHILKQDLLNT